MDTPRCQQCGEPIKDFRPSRNSRFCSRACANRAHSGRSICVVDGCAKPVHGNGYCTNHYRAVRFHGDPLHQRWAPWHERLWARVDQSGGAEACWPWTGALHQSTGYGQFWRVKNGTAHAAMYEYAHGPVADGMEIDHTCFNRACVNPAHLEAVTRQENLRRRDGRKAAQKAA